MSLGLCFWIVYLVALVFTGIRLPRDDGWALPNAIIPFLLWGLLGWATFGPPIR